MEKDMMLGKVLYIFKEGQVVDVKSAICIGNAPDDQMIYLESAPEVYLGEDEDDPKTIYPEIVYLAISETFTEEELKKVSIVPNSTLYLYGMQINYHILNTGQSETNEPLYSVITAISCTTPVCIYPDTNFLLLNDNDTKKQTRGKTNAKK